LDLERSAARISREEAAVRVALEQAPLPTRDIARLTSLTMGVAYMRARAVGATRCQDGRWRLWGCPEYSRLYGLRVHSGCLFEVCSSDLMLHLLAGIRRSIWAMLFLSRRGSRCLRSEYIEAP